MNTARPLPLPLPFTGRNRGPHRRPPGFLGVEAAGLRWLEVPGGVSIVPVLAVSPVSITVGRITEVRPTARAAARFGARLALTHDAGAPAFGSPPAAWSDDGYIGDAPLSLRPRPGWGDFYAEQRVLPYAGQARRLGSLAVSGFTVIEALAERVGGTYGNRAAEIARRY